MGDYFGSIIAAIPGIVALVTLTIELIKYVQKFVKEKNWSNMLDLVMTYMKAAEEKFLTGAERKEWVLAMVEASAKTTNYDVDMNAVSTLIDELCALTKKVNPPSDKTSKDGVVHAAVTE